MLNSTQAEAELFFLLYFYFFVYYNQPTKK